MLLFISKGRLFRVNGRMPIEIKCGFVEKYIDNLKEISKKREWKSSGTGAQFMNMAMPFSDTPEDGINISGITTDGDGIYIYSAVFDGNMAIYKSSGKSTDDEGVILRKNSVRIFEMDNLPGGKKMLAAGKEGSSEKHIAMIDKEKSELYFITEGDSVDANPSFSRAEPDIVYYDSKGVGVSAQNSFVRFSPCAILRLDLSTGDLDEFIADGAHDYFKPKTDSAGNLYYIRRPYKENQRKGMDTTDILLIPFKFLKAIFGWMDFFTRRYSGETLNTSGNNPAKTKQLSEEELFIEGNMINVEKNLRENQASGEKYPGLAPKSWELIRRGKDGREHIIKKGVIDYCLAEDGIYYSNGSNVLRTHPESSSTEELVCEVKIAQSLLWVQEPAFIKRNIES